MEASEPTEGTPQQLVDDPSDLLKELTTTSLFDELQNRLVALSNGDLPGGIKRNIAMSITSMEDAYIRFSVARELAKARQADEDASDSMKVDTLRISID